jgi:hypothetical protein
MENKEIEFDLTKREERSKTLPVLFFGQMIYDEKESLEKGRLIFKNKPFIEIETGGNSSSDIKTFPVNEEFKQRYKKEWEKFNNFIAPLIKTNTNEIIDLNTIFKDFPQVFEEYKKNIKDTIGDGTLIEEMGIYPLTKAIELKYYGYFFIEQILALKEANNIISKEMIEIAKKWQEKQQENEILKKQVVELSNLVNILTKRVKEDGRL